MKPTNDQLRQLLDLPDQINELDRNHNGMKSAKLKVQRELDGMEARHRIRISKEGGYSNAEDRKAALTIALEDDEKYSARLERLDALDGMIRANRAQFDLLRRQRESIRALAELDFVTRLEAALSDKDLATLVSARLLA
jgi:multidrug efflux pump subunit AcrA (membrane-fusion protein)